MFAGASCQIRALFVLGRGIIWLVRRWRRAADVPTIRSDCEEGDLDGTAIRECRPAPPWRPRAALAWRADGPARRGCRRGNRSPLRTRRASPPAGASVLVPVVR